MATKVKAVFKASDSSEHPTSKAAEKHNDLVVARRALEAALEVFNRALGETGLTADGEHFNMNKIRDYWYIHDRFYGMPQVGTLYSWPPHLNVSSRPDEPSFVLTDYCGSSDKPKQYRIGDLYAHKANAEAACVELAKRRLKEFTQQVKELARD